MKNPLTSRKEKKQEGKRVRFPRTLPALLMGGGVLLSIPGAWVAAAPARPVRVVAYINLTSGCQKPTEAVLRRLAARYPKRLHLEFVDFGGAGRARWIRDGMHCMGIQINGSTKVRVMEKGVPILVPFQMPVGYNWTLKELEAAIRQAVEGVSRADKTPPLPDVKTEGDKAVLRLDGRPALRLPVSEKSRLERVAALIRAAEKKKGGLVREDFAVAAPEKGRPGVTLRGKNLITVSPADAARDGTAPKALAKKWLEALAAPFPVRTRPLPNGRRPWKLKTRSRRSFQP